MTAGATSAAATLEVMAARRERVRVWAETFGILVVALLVLIAFAATSELFLHPVNLRNILIQISVVSVAAIGATVVLLAGSIDLSVGGVVLLGAVVIGDLAERRGIPLPLAIGGGLAATTLVGIVSGVLVALLRVEAILATLGTLLLSSRGREADPRERLDRRRATTPSRLWLGTRYC